ncbi:uncharacterized protein AC631_05936, partial [Debaryomyces fabryi]
MAKRDLTYNTPRQRYNEDLGVENPFILSIGEESSFELHDHSSSSQLVSYGKVNSHMGNPVYDAGFKNYNGYYSRITTNRNFNEYPSDDRQEIRGSPVIINSQPSPNIQEPLDYDRYPNIAGSNMISSTSLTSNIYNSQNFPNIDDNSSTSNKSSRPLLGSKDFNPFGGYPASSFPLHIDEKEPDDYLHNPDPLKDAIYDKNRFFYDLKNMDRRSLGGLLGVVFLIVAAVVVFILLPVLTYSGITDPYTPESYEILTSYRYPLLSAIRS